jgi:hypothetical protein
VSESADEPDDEAGENEVGEDEAEAEEMAGAVEDMLETIRQAKAKAAIDVIDALLPLLSNDVDEEIRRDFGQALTSLKLAYANAVAAAE